MVKTNNLDFENTIRKRLAQQEFMKVLGFAVTTVEVGCVEGELLLGPEHRQHMGFAHGGLIATLADIVAGLAAMSLVAPDQHVVTAELKISFLNPGVGDKLLAKGWVLKPGSRLNFCEAEVYVVKGEELPLLIAKASATMATITAADIRRED